MAISNYVPYEGDLTAGYTVNPSDWNGMFDTLATYINTILVPAINTCLSSVAGLPTGGIIMWWSTSFVPAGWALCNGQTVNWITGPLAGNPVTLPNYIGMNIQGSDITGGSSTPNASGWGATTNQSTVGNINHSHTASLTGSTSSTSANIAAVRQDSPTSYCTVQAHSHTVAVGGITANASAQPPAIGIPLIMKL